MKRFRFWMSIAIIPLFLLACIDNPDYRQATIIAMWAWTVLALVTSPSLGMRRFRPKPATCAKSQVDAKWQAVCR